MEKTYQICNKCIMDMTDPDIKFDNLGICFHCYSYKKTVDGEVYRKRKWFS